MVVDEAVEVVEAEVVSEENAITPAEATTETSNETE